MALLHCRRDVINYESLEVYYLMMLSVAKVICVYKLFKSICNVYIRLYVLTHENR